MAWWHDPANSKVSMEALEIVKGKAAVFVNWLKNEIEGSSSDSEDSDDSDVIAIRGECHESGHHYSYLLIHIFVYA